MRLLLKLEDNLSDLNRAKAMLDIPVIALDFITSICGEQIGAGVFRSVFFYNLDDKYVVKVEPLNTSCNIVEHMIWDEVQGLTGRLEWVKNWFAPVKWISPSGRILVMQRTKSIPSRKKPDKVPSFLWDVKPDNFGWIGKNYVCHDYGQLYNMIHYPPKFKKAYWDKY